MVSTPEPPSPEATAAAQGQMNKETAIAQANLNAVDYVTPYGNITTTQTGTWSDGTPKYTQTTALSDAQQAVLDQTQGAQLNLATIANDQSAFLNEYLDKPFTFDNNSAETWAYDLASPRILQQQQQNEDQLRSTLAAKGIREGSAAWNAEMQRLTNANTDQLNQLALTGRQQAYNEALSTYNAPINTISALMSGSQVTGPNTATSATSQTPVAGVDYTGLVNQKYQADLANSRSAMGGLFGLLGAGISAFSDRRLKENIRKVGETFNGTPIYVYNFIGDLTPQMGVMAQELAEKQPEAVVMDPSGYLKVLYAEVR
jgi:hypothetical protein